MADIGTTTYLICALCNEHVVMEAANTNENGKAVHEECYVAYISSRYHSLITIEHALSIVRGVTPQRDATAAIFKLSL